MWVFIWVLSICGEGQITLRNGKTLNYDAYRQAGNVMLVRSGNEVFSLRKDEVDFSRSEVSQKQRAASSWTPVGRRDDAQSFPGQDFIIQRLDVKQASLIDLIRFLADMVGFNLYIDGSVEDQKVTYLFKNISWKQALEVILSNAGLNSQMQHTMLSVR